MKVNLTETQVRATRAALYQQWDKITDCYGHAVNCTQEMVDATYEALQVLERVEKMMSDKKANLLEEEFVETSIGMIPLDYYYDVKAIQKGYSDYNEMRSKGLFIDKPFTVTKEELESKNTYERG